MPDLGPAVLSQWMLDPAITYLNHGTVGAPPRRVLAEQQAIRDEIERQPATFLLRELADVDGVGDPLIPRMRIAAAPVAELVGVETDELAFVDNATTGINAVLRSFPFVAGDEILVTSHGYGSVAKVASYVAGRTEATVRTITLPRPGASPADFVEAIETALDVRTRMLIVDHVTSQTALVLPLAGIAARCRAAGVLVLADGAHGPGAIDLDIPSLGVDWYTGNLHKWAWTPRSAGILWATAEQRATLHPAVISWGFGNGLAAEFDLLGTRDPTPFLAAPAAIAMMREWGLATIQQYDHDLAWNAARLLCERWGTEFSTPESMIGTMVTVALPRSLGNTELEARALQAAILAEDRIEVPVFGDGGGLSLRVSAQVYNDLADIERLAEAVAARVQRR